MNTLYSKPLHCLSNIPWFPITTSQNCSKSKHIKAFFLFTNFCLLTQKNLLLWVLFFQCSVQVTFRSVLLQCCCDGELLYKLNLFQQDVVFCTSSNLCRSSSLSHSGAELKKVEKWSFLSNDASTYTYPSLGLAEGSLLTQKSHAHVAKFGTDWSAAATLSLRKIPQVFLPEGEASLRHQVYQVHEPGFPPSLSRAPLSQGSSLPTAASPQPCSSLVPLPRPHPTASTSPQSSSGLFSSSWPPPWLAAPAQVFLLLCLLGQVAEHILRLGAGLSWCPLELGTMNLEESCGPTWWVTWLGPGNETKLCTGIT